MEDEESAGYSPLKFNENTVRLKSPQKKINLLNDASLGSDLINPRGADQKQSRSLSRGRP